MGHVRVKSGSIDNGLITELTVELLGLGTRTLDRDTVVAWMKDGHSLIANGTAMQLVAVPDGDEEKHFVRADNAAEQADSLPDGLDG